MPLMLRFPSMSMTPPRTVKETGAIADDLLVGVTPRNMGVVVRIYNNQTPEEGGRIAGAFDLIQWGSGTYHREILKVWHTRNSFSSVKDFIELLESEFPKTRFSHGLNANGLWRLDAEAIAAEIINQG